MFRWPLLTRAWPAWVGLLLLLPQVVMIGLSPAQVTAQDGSSPRPGESGRGSGSRSRLLEASSGVSIALDTEKPLTPTEARQRVGQSVWVEMEVRGAKDRLEKRGEIYLDSETDFHDERNLAIVITRQGADSLRQQGITDPAEHFRGKIIRVRGTVQEKDQVRRIEVQAADQIERVPAG